MYLEKIFLPLLLSMTIQSYGIAQDILNRDLVNNKVPQSLLLSHIEINDHFIDYKKLDDPEYRQQFEFGDALRGSFDSVAAHNNYPLNLKLPHYLNNPTFYFSAIDWKALHKIQYMYFMQGYDAAWSEPVTSGKAEYHHLPHGNYIFKIKAMGESQIWSEPFVYPFIIKKPWWLSGWAQLLYAVLVAGVIYAVFHFLYERKRQKEEIRRLLEAYKLTDFPKAFEKKKGSLESGFLKLVQITLETHLSDENFGIAELCELLNISRAQLHRKLKNLTGLSTSHYIRSLRLEIAKDLLETTNMNVSEVAYNVGFGSAAYFSKVFKDHYGMAPIEFK